MRDENGGINPEDARKVKISQNEEAQVQRFHLTRTKIKQLEENQWLSTLVLD